MACGAKEEGFGPETAMDTLKIVHCADLHLGAELPSLGERAAQRRQELLQTFFRIVQLCKQERANALLIAGDFFEGAGGSSSREVMHALGEIPDTVVAIAPGNHDYYCAASPYAEEGWPKNAVIFRSALEYREFPEKRLRLWGAAFTGTYQEEPLLRARAPRDDYINICALHGDLAAEGQKTPYNPVTSAQIEASGMDYLALGHIHKRSEILKRGETSFAYPGCPEGMGFDEPGEKGVYVGTVYKGGAELSFSRVCRRMNLEASADITAANSDRAAAEIALHALERAHGPQFREHLYKLTLTGAPQGYTPDCAAVAGLLSEEGHLYYAKVKNGVRPAEDLELLGNELSLKGIFVRRMLERMRAGKDAADERALYLGLKAFSGEAPYED